MLARIFMGGYNIYIITEGFWGFGVNVFERDSETTRILRNNARGIERVVTATKVAAS